jgi:hypothetical protein
MPQESERPRPQGDPLQQDPQESNPAQRDSDATPDVVASQMVEDPIDSGTSVNGLPAYDEADGERRKKLYREGADLVSRID